MEVKRQYDGEKKIIFFLYHKFTILDEKNPILILFFQLLGRIEIYSHNIPCDTT